MGLKVERFLNERVVIDTSDGRMFVTLYELRDNSVKLDFTGPQSMKIYREEIAPVPEPPRAAEACQDVRTGGRR